MAAPVAIGTRGTIGSLVRKEIEYFTKFELERRGTTIQKPQQHLVDMDMDMVSRRSYSIMSRPSLWFLPTNWRRRKQRGTSTTSRFLSKICSVTDVGAETNQLNRIPGYSYRILKTDINNFQL